MQMKENEVKEEKFDVFNGDRKMGFLTGLFDEDKCRVYVPKNQLAPSPFAEGCHLISGNNYRFNFRNADELNYVFVSDPADRKAAVKEAPVKAVPVEKKKKPAAKKTGQLTGGKIRNRKRK